jgi:hypothetical protein
VQMAAARRAADVQLRIADAITAYHCLRKTYPTWTEPVAFGKDPGVRPGK